MPHKFRQINSRNEKKQKKQKNYMCRNKKVTQINTKFPQASPYAKDATEKLYPGKAEGFSIHYSVKLNLNTMVSKTCRDFLVIHVGSG